MTMIRRQHLNTVIYACVQYSRLARKHHGIEPSHPSHILQQQPRDLQTSSSYVRLPHPCRSSSSIPHSLCIGSYLPRSCCSWWKVKIINLLSASHCKAMFHDIAQSQNLPILPIILGRTKIVKTRVGKYWYRISSDRINVYYYFLPYPFSAWPLWYYLLLLFKEIIIIIKLPWGGGDSGCKSNYTLCCMLFSHILETFSQFI